MLTPAGGGEWHMGNRSKIGVHLYIFTRAFSISTVSVCDSALEKSILVSTIMARALSMVKMVT